jgi:hypothetical protein
MQTPSFFADAPTITLADPLANFLGAATDGVITYEYADAVKLAGHSCPTVAGAYLMTRQALAHLYGDDTPERGNIKVDLRDPIDEAVTGVIGNVIGLITGAAGDGGFKGIGPRFRRAGLMAYGIKQEQEVRFIRVDTGASIGADYNASIVAPHASQGPLMQAIMSGTATPDDVQSFGAVWQQRVSAIMTSPELWSQLVTLS